MFSVEEAYTRANPNTSMSAMMASPMLQRMLSGTADAPELPTMAIQEVDAESSTTAPAIVLRSKTPKSFKRKPKTSDSPHSRKGSNAPDLTAPFKGPTLKDLKHSKGNQVERILENLQAAGEEGRQGRMRRMQMQHASMAQKYAAEAGIVQ